LGRSSTTFSASKDASPPKRRDRRPRQTVLRLFLLQGVVLLVFAGFTVRLWRLQVVAGARYSEMARRNRTRLVTQDTARGVMYDRTGALLVRNIPRFDVLLIPAFLPDDPKAHDALLQRLHELLDLPLVSDLAPPPFPPFQGSARLGLRDRVEQGALYAPYRPIPLKQDVSQETAFTIEQEHLDLPGVLVETGYYREYLTGATTAHLVGYMGPIPAGAEDRYSSEQGYGPNDSIGLSGLEYSYEDQLRGRKGQKTIEVDVAGREVQTLGQAILPQPGTSLRLALDLDLQAFIQQELNTAMHAAAEANAEAGIPGTESHSAVAIVTHVHSGQVLAMVSLPTFDNNLFAQGISAKEFVRLNTDPSHPLLNHAIAGQYPPGSTFKLVPAAAALEEEIVDPWTTITCPEHSGILLLPNKYYPDNPTLAQPFYCWTHKYNYGHGHVQFLEAVAESCDIYFYLVGGGMLEEFDGLGLERLRTYAGAFGYGSPTGIDLPAEAPGLVPGERWKRITHGERWTTGDTYNMAIGQGFVLATPLQVVQATAAVANGGTVYQPQLVYQLLDDAGEVVQTLEPTVVTQLPISKENLRLVREGMRAAVTEGTAQWMEIGGGLEVAAKTGTAEFCEKYPDCLDEDGVIATTHAWFTAFAPYQDPEIAAVVFIYGGGEGAITAMPVVGEIINYYFQLY
jgi:penicillin-binding protein 2